MKTKVIHPDEELFEKSGLDRSFERIPIPTTITKILRRKVKDKVLICHYARDRHDTAIMHYVSFKDGFLHQYAGYSFGIYPEQTLKETLIMAAEDIAESWPEYAVRKRKKQ